MPIVELNLTPSQRDLRWFAGLWWPATCAAIGLMLFSKFHGRATGISVWVGGAMLAMLGVIAPAMIRPVYVGLLRLTYPIGWCVSHVTLAAIYFLVVTPAGFLVRLFQDPMTRRFERTEITYWTAREASRENHMKWWLTPIVIVMFLFGLLVVLAGTGAAPFIYTLF